MTLRTLLLALPLAACAPGPGPDRQLETDSDGASTAWPQGVWNRRLPASEALTGVRGRRWVRAGVHLHSPYSHDACDGQGWSPDGLDEACHARFARALCDARIDLALLTDHPDYGATVPLADRFVEGATPVMSDDRWWGAALPCEDGHTVLAQSGFEDTLMPVGLRTEVSTDATTRHDLLNRDDPGAFDAMRSSEGFVFLAHTEGREPSVLEGYQDAGLHALEAFNVHAAFSPDIRRDDLGLSGTGWAAAVGPFVQGEEGLEPNLLFLGVLEHQRPSLNRWDALLARGPMMATFGSDAHENVLPAEMSDGERLDSYRRVLRMGTTWLLADDASPKAIDEAIAARRAHVVVELLGTPAGLDLHVLQDDGTKVEVGSTAGVGTLVVGCPTLADGSPRGPEAPELSIRVLRDGEPFAEGCGEHAVGPGVYRVEIDSTPHHLRPFLGTEPESFLRPYPWIYTGAIRVEAGG